MDVFASAAFVLGTAVYNRFLSAWSYRSILRAVQVVLMAVNMLDLVWTSRWNLLLGLPDAYFAMGYEVLQPLAKRSNLIPIFILAAKCARSGGAPRLPGASRATLDLWLTRAGPASGQALPAARASDRLRAQYGSRQLWVRGGRLHGHCAAWAARGRRAA
jgi:hypothetical protein